MSVRLLLFAALLLAAGCATVDTREDMRIEAEVKARLVAEKDANLTRIDVMSTRGTVYLSGAVESAESRSQAEVLASQVRGVTRVVNKLEVRQPPRDAHPKHPQPLEKPAAGFVVYEG